MSKCNINRIVANKVGYNKLDKTTAEVTFNLSRDIDSCVKINTKNYVAYVGSTAPVYSRLAVPQDMINVCESFGCKNSGTLMINTNNTGSDSSYTHTASATFAKSTNAILFSAGVMFMYIDFPAVGNYELAVTIADIKDSTMTNADVYKQTVSVAHEGYQPITVDLAKAPEETEGEGWTATTQGIRVKVEVSSTSAEETGYMVGMSSISFFEDIDDLANNEVVKLGCLTGIEGDDTIDALEEMCLGAKYDTSTTTVERTITASTWTPNVLMLNPLMQRTEKTDGYYIATIEATVNESTDHEGYGEVQLADAYIEKCGFTYASLADACNVNDAILTRIEHPNLMNLDERQFQVVNSKLNPNVDFEGSYLYFNKELVGKTVIISYPRASEVESFVATENGINERRVQMSYSKVQSDGVFEVHEYPNVLITSFPQTINNSDSEFSFTVSVQRDVDGSFFHVMKHNRTGEYL